MQCLTCGMRDIDPLSHRHEQPRPEQANGEANDIWISHFDSRHRKGEPCNQCAHHDAPAAPERSVSTWRKEYTRGRGYRINDSLGCVAEVCEEALADLIIAEHNQHSTLITQRERLLQAAKIALSTPGFIRGRELLQKRVDEAITASEQEGRQA